MLQEAADYKLYRIVAVFIASYITNKNKSNLQSYPISSSVIAEITSRKNTKDNEEEMNL